MIEVASLLGVSYSGKSTIAKGVVARLANESIPADIIKKDEALKALGKERYGYDDASGGYSIKGFIKNGSIPSHELHGWMNTRIKMSRELGRLVLLEGGTRTRTAETETLSQIDLTADTYRIFMLDLPFTTVIQRARQRRQESGRYDDMLPVAAAKLLGQYRGAHSADAPQAADIDVKVLDARQPVNELIEQVTQEILDPTTLH